jgi:predicted phosphodiesterase
MVLAKEIIENSNIKMGIIHPYFGGPDSSLVRKIIKEFKKDCVKVIVFGHTHDPKILLKNELLLINPGKGYIDPHSINPCASIAILEIGSHLKVRIKQINF